MNNNIYRIWKRAVSVLVTMCLIAVMTMSPLAVGVAYADGTELPDKDPGKGTACSTTAFGWVYEGLSASDTWDTKTWQFDIVGLTGAQTDYSKDGMKTTYGYRGYATYIIVNNGDKKKIEITHNGGVETYSGVDVRIALSPSPDNKYIYADYYVCNRDNSAKHVQLGTGTDTMVNTDDGVTLYLTARGLHMVSTKDNSAFDCITNDSALGIDKVDGVWRGSWGGGDWRNHIFDNNPEFDGKTSDTAMAYSWDLQLHPYELVHKRVAFSMKDTTYYVSNKPSVGSDTANDGTYQRPFATIQHAVDQLAGKKGYIFLMDDYEIKGPIEISGASTDITFGSTDFTTGGLPVSDKKRLTRSADSTDSLFQVSNGGTLKIQDLTLDGAGTESASPLVSVEGTGKLEINTGANITNCHGNASSQGSAVNITGDASLSMNFGTISGNTSEGKGAVYFNGKTFNVKNKVTISDNTAPGGKNANVYLANGKKITVGGDLQDSKIGVTTEQQPKVSPETGATNIDQEVKIAVPAKPDDVMAPCPFVDNFTVDNPGAYIIAGTQNLADAGTDNDKNAVLRKHGLNISFTLVDTEGASVTIPDANKEFFATKVMGAGDAVHIAPPPAIDGYELSSVSVDQGTSTLLTVTTAPGASLGQIDGTMPNQDVLVVYTFAKGDATIKFDTRGGTPQPPDLTGKGGAPIPSTLPTVSRYGYKFKGWSTSDDWNTTELLTGMPDAFPAGTTTYHAVYEIDGSIGINWKAEYTNQSGNIEFKLPNTEWVGTTGHVEDQLNNVPAKKIKNYVFSKDDSSTTPSQYIFRDALEYIGHFDETGNGSFSGKIPGQDTTLNFRYKVDYGNEASKSKLTVKYQSADGIELAGDSETMLYPEDQINVQPADVYGYKCVGEPEITAGGTAADTADGFVYAVTGTSDPDTYAYTGTMPNQDVTLVYKYETTLAGYDMTVKYVDTVSQDPGLKDIVAPIKTSPHPAGSTVGTAAGDGTYKELYGYNIAGSQVDPSNASITVGSNWEWSGTMPNNDAQITYNYTRDNDKWAKITYEGGDKGTLQPGSNMSADVSDLGGGSYRASVLRNDDTDDGRAGAYTMAQIKAKGLAPVAVPAQSQYYVWDGWCLPGNDQPLPDDYQFTGDTVVTAHYSEAPGAWVNIKFAAGSHGTLRPGAPTTKHTTSDQKWKDIWSELPEYDHQVNYLVDGWYDEEGNKLDQNNTSSLKEGQTYTIKFKPQPDVFGTNVTAPNAAAGLNTDGKGRITVYGTTQNYQYVLTDSDGRVLAVNRGAQLSDRTEFDALYPGMEYTVYEAAEDAAVREGDLIGSATGDVSAGTPVLTPVLDTNYRIDYDEETEGKTRLHIEPADRASEYAVLDKNGNLVNTPQTGDGGWQKPAGNPGRMDFTGLAYNEEYTVVARPAGQTEITAESRRLFGSVITTDPGGELELTNYTVIAQNGTVESVGSTEVNQTSYDEAHKDDLVKVKAEHTSGTGTFDHWEFTIGSVKDLKRVVKTPEFSFTMPDTNLVLTAVYSYPDSSTPSNAKVVDDVRGGNREELALDPNEIPDLEESLTTPDDEVLLDTNKADVTYKVVYRKNAVKASESNAIKVNEEYAAHEDAYKGAWGLDVSIERYVDGRLVNRATDSNATFKTFVQLDKKDVDMMDYHLYEIVEDEGNVSATPVTLEDNLEETGGLFSFDATEGSRYVMVYNRAYRLYFLNKMALPGSPDYGYRYWFKVRRNEAPSDDTYYGDVYNESLPRPQEPSFVSPAGVNYDNMVWSYKEGKEKPVFNEDKKITRKTYIYAYYDSNVTEVNDARKQLEDAVKAAIGISDDHFLKAHESEQLKEFIKAAQDVLDEKDPQATVDRLEEAISALAEHTKPYKELLDQRYDHYDDIQNNSHKGGSSGGGGGGNGTKQAPFNDTAPNSYRIGTNGSWIETAGPGGEKQMSFRLNGGSLLSGMWAKLEYPAGDQSAGNGWYRFDSKGVMQTGWICDEKGNWYYCNTQQDGYAGKMATDWKQDGKDGNWYYLDPASGAMALGWKQIGGKWYYFSPVGGGVYAYDPAKENWTYGGGSGRPMGSMYKNEMTPDGYQVGADGAWIQ